MRITDTMYLLWTLVWLFCGIVVSIDQHELCVYDHFRAECNPDEVIWMTSAVLGRWRLNDCVQTSYGKLPCYDNALAKTDSLCSGRQSCDFMVGTSLQSESRECPSDLSKNFNGSYECVKVETAPTHDCKHGIPITLTSLSGYIANRITVETNKGSNACPWVIQAKPGQRINVTLINFARIQTSEITKDRARVCYKYGIIKEDNVIRTITKCQGGPREEPAFLSTGHMITIEVLGDKNSNQGFHVLFKYEVFGCADMIPPQGATFKKLSSTTGVVRCNSSNESWKVTCDKTAWTGNVGKCSSSSSDAGSNDKWTNTNDNPFSDGFPYGILVVVAIGVGLGVFLGGVLLICASRYLRRKKQRRPQEGPYHTTVYDTDDSKMVGEQFTGIPLDRQMSCDSTHKCKAIVDGKELTEKDLVQVYGYYGSLPPGYLAIAKDRSHVYESPQNKQNE